MEIRNSTNNKIIRLNKKKIRCPNCNKQSERPFAPFCSKKCADVDLMKWLSDQNYIKFDSK